MKFSQLLPIFNNIPIEFNGVEPTDTHDVVCYDASIVLDCLDNLLEMEEIEQEEYDFINAHLEDNQYLCVDFKEQAILSSNNDDFINSLKLVSKTFAVGLTLPTLTEFISHCRKTLPEKFDNRNDEENIILNSFFKAFYLPKIER